MEDNITEVSCQSLVIDGACGHVKMNYTPINSRVGIEAIDVMAISKNKENLSITIQGKFHYISTIPKEEITLLAQIESFYSSLKYRAIINDASKMTLFVNVHLINETEKKIMAENVVIRSFNKKRKSPISENHLESSALTAMSKRSESFSTVSEEQYVYLNLKSKIIIPNIEYVFPLDNINLKSNGTYFFHRLGTSVLDCIEEVIPDAKLIQGKIDFYNKSMIHISHGWIEQGLQNNVTKIHHINNNSLTIVESIEGELEGLIIVQNNTTYDMKFVYTHPRMKEVRKSIIINANERKIIKEELINDIKKR